MDGPPQPMKRRLETPSSPVQKRARLSKENLLQQPMPKPPARASFLDPITPTDAVFEWLQSLGADGQRRCRSASHLDASDDLVSRNPTRSAPPMSYNRDADGYVVPPTPGSSYASVAPSVAPSDATSSKSSKTLVETQLYRELNLAANGIYMREQDEQLPGHVYSLVDRVRRSRESPGPSHNDVWRDKGLSALEMKGLDEAKVENCFKERLFPNPDDTGSLQRSDRQPMHSYVVPASSANAKLKVSKPAPDMLYGYNRDYAFRDQRAQLSSMGYDPVANRDGTVYPFLVVEFKGSAGDLWVAANQCLGGSAACVNLIERFNRQNKPVDSTAFSIAMNGTEARLYVTWRHGDLPEYYMQKIDSFCLQKPRDYIEFRRIIKNIIDWGREERLTEIRESLNTPGAGGTTREAPKARPPPTSPSSQGKRHRRSDPK